MTVCDVEREVLLLEVVASNAAVHAAVARIDDHSAEGAGGIDDARRAAGQQENAGGKQEPDNFGIDHGGTASFDRLAGCVNDGYSGRH